ncbi:hypothetical protein [Xanthomonas phaseoli]|uniref:hypothetical protein n=1 Tax=Xanthomonas phaseoli TaxID=1985254 RepID=UPI001E60F459|nr:hypothetical protein [Xanthomonas phaseoli]MCC8468818.1 hypothetical protein [Xanthomonas phaseoli]
MIFLGRVFASAIARRLAYLLVAIVLGVLGMGNARAASTAQEAYALCMQSASVHVPKDTNLVTKAGSCPEKTAPNGGKFYQCQYEAAQYYQGPVGIVTCGDFAFDEDTNSCPSKPDQFGWLVDGLGTKCYDGCTYAYNPTAGGYSTTGTTCTPNPDEPEPQLDTDGDGVPDDKDAFPNDPNESKDTDGDGIGDNSDVAPDDPENGKDDKDGDEKDNQASGGGTCGAPPSCSGDAIACNTNWQIWRLRCQGTATGSVTGDVTNCSAGVNVTSPDPLANANIILQRKIACKTGDSNGNQGDGEQPAWTKVNGMSQDPGKGGSNSDIPGINEVQVTADTLDQSGFGGGACVGFVAASSGTGVSSGFTQSLATPPAFFCDYIGWLKLAIITGAAIYSVITISKGHA